MAPSAILDFEIQFSDNGLLMSICRGLNLWSLTVLWSAIEKLLRFLFSIGNALEVPKMAFLGIWGVKTELCIFVNPKRHLLASKHAFWRITRPNRSTIVACGLLQWKKTGNSSGIKFKMTVGGHLVFENYKVVTWDLIGRSFLIKSC